MRSLPPRGAGVNGIAILAQSVAAGGGLALGGRPTGTTAAELLGAGVKTGNVNQGDNTTPADNEGVHVTVNGSVSTSGAGGVGDFAQSAAAAASPAKDGDIGSGNVSSQYLGWIGDIDVTVGQSVTIHDRRQERPPASSPSRSAAAAGSPATPALVGSAGSSGFGGNVNVTVDGQINAKGSASAGIIVQSTGGCDRPGGAGNGQTVNVTVNQTGWDLGGAGSFQENQAAVYVLNAGTGSRLSNYGVIDTNQSSDVKAGDFAATQETGGYIKGNTDLASNDFINNGTYLPLSTVALGDGTLKNAGTLDLTAAPANTRLTGDFACVAGSRTIRRADFLKGAADRLIVSGDATFAGGVEVRPRTLVPRR